MLKKSSVNIAKSRIRTLITSDRIQCSAVTYEIIYKELYETLAKYIEFTEDDFEVSIDRHRIIITFAGEKL
jgi:cell division topological specificity factor